MIVRACLRIHTLINLPVALQTTALVFWLCEGSRHHRHNKTGNSNEALTAPFCVSHVVVVVVTIVCAGADTLPLPYSVFYHPLVAVNQWQHPYNSPKTAKVMWNAGCPYYSHVPSCYRHSTFLFFSFWWQCFKLNGKLSFWKGHFKSQRWAISCVSVH